MENEYSQKKYSKKINIKSSEILEILSPRQERVQDGGMAFMAASKLKGAIGKAKGAIGKAGRGKTNKSSGGPPGESGNVPAGKANGKGRIKKSVKKLAGASKETVKQMGDWKLKHPYIRKKIPRNHFIFDLYDVGMKITSPTRIGQVTSDQVWGLYMFFKKMKDEKVWDKIYNKKGGAKNWFD